MEGRLAMARGPTLLMIRPEAQSVRFLEQLKLPKRLTPVIAPILTIEHHPVAPQAVGTLILTSVNAVPAAAGITAARVYTVGRSTAAAAEAAGLAAIAGDGDAHALIARILAARVPEPVLHLRGAHTRGNLVETLARSGLQVQDIVAYTQVATPLAKPAKAALKGEGLVIVPLFSPRTAQLFSEAARKAKAEIWPIAMSPAVAEALNPRFHPHLVTAPAPTGAAMRDLVQRRIDTACHLEAPGRAG